MFISVSTCKQIKFGFVYQTILDLKTSDKVTLSSGKSNATLWVVKKNFNRFTF